MTHSDRMHAQKIIAPSEISMRDSKICWLPSPFPTDIFIGKSLDLPPKRFGGIPERQKVKRLGFFKFRVGVFKGRVGVG